MKHVPQPVHLVLRELDVEAVERASEGIRAKRSRRRAIPLLLAAALVTSALLAALAFWARPSGAGPLRDPNGIASAFTGGDAGGTARLSDDSVITLDKGAQVRVLENTDTAFTMVLTRGAAVFDVKPGGPRRWRVELGCGAVEVVGTRFSIDRGEARVIVRVERGAVLVRSDQLQPDHVERLEAGGSLVLVLPRSPRPSSTPRRPSLRRPPSPPPWLRPRCRRRHLRTR
jgi:transmembrane sensor